jgi:hypothetical protein
MAKKCGFEMIFEGRQRHTYSIYIGGEYFGSGKPHEIGM